MATTTDRIAVVFYGAGAHPSLANGLTAAVDLVAGQPGPWDLTDEDRAAWAAGLVDQLGGGTGLDALTSTLARARHLIFDLVSEHGDHMPKHLVHDSARLDERIGSFLNSYPNGAALQAVLATRTPAPAPETPADPPATEAPAPGGLPTLEQAVAFRRDEWIALMTRHGAAVPTMVAALKQDAATAGLAEVRSLADAVGKEALCRILLTLLEDHVS